MVSRNEKIDEMRGCQCHGPYMEQIIDAHTHGFKLNNYIIGSATRVVVVVVIYVTEKFLPSTKILLLDMYRYI